MAAWRAGMTRSGERAEVAHSATGHCRRIPERSLRRHEALQLLEPVEDNVDLGWRRVLFRGRLDHQKAPVRRDVIVRGRCAAQLVVPGKRGVGLPAVKTGWVATRTAIIVFPLR